MPEQHFAPYIDTPFIYLLLISSTHGTIHNITTVFWIVFDFYLLKKMDQRTCIKFCVKNEIKCADAFRMLTVAYGEATLDRSNVYRWYKMFSEGRDDVNDEERAGRPSTSTTDEKINEVEKMILANRRITVREVAEDLNISISSCHSIFMNDLGMRRVAAKFVPKLLNCDQKQHRMNIANEMLDSVRDDPNLLQRVITGDEAWVYGYDVETKAQSSQWKLPHEPRPKKARQVRSNVKVLLTVFFDCRGVVHHEFLPQGRTVNKEYYLQVMRNLREAIRQKRPDLWKNKNWLLHHDNAPAHTSLLVRDFLAKNNTLMMPQPPYSPDLAPCDFFLFPKLKRPMKGGRALYELAYTFLRFVPPLLLNTLVENKRYLLVIEDCALLFFGCGDSLLIENVGSDQEPQWHGYLYSALMLVSSVVAGLASQHVLFCMIGVGMQVRSALIAAVYRKFVPRVFDVVDCAQALRLSNGARQNFTVGEQVNFMAVDAEKVYNLSIFLNMLWGAPLRIIISVILLWQYLGPSCLAGVAIMVVMMPITLVVAHFCDKIQAFMKSKLPLYHSSKSYVVIYTKNRLFDSTC
ncbi:hypothetical protein LAZ67_18001593 [Cordylochernes scorpioides]|uniref:ABC transmembrane type-1 domain-containing protein n=1 Tax=Cordylochernes scorpioides TaxID=51811 RepID=A0ABY6LIN9_9ARAC|nr:hypothetical protein LAZ67_18001593 [Cordylochernes scorpioides]